jgi:hypothetical protein
MDDDQHWIHFEKVINEINNSKDPADNLANFIVILLAKVKLNTEEMSDAIQNGFLFYESLNEHDRNEIIKGFDSHLLSLKN